MLKQTIEESISDEQTLLPKGSLVDLGNYREFIHNHDESRSFSVTFKIAPPIDLYDAIPAEQHVLDNGESEGINGLKQSIKSLPLGITIDFAFNNAKGVHVTKIDLLVGDDSTPIITFVNESPESMESLRGDADKEVKNEREKQWHIYQRSPKNYLKFKKIENHDYWAIYDGTVRSDELAIEALKTIGSKELSFFDDKKLKESIIALKDSPAPLSKEEEYKDDFLILSKFLPVELNDYNPQYLLNDRYDFAEHDNISVLILAVSFLIKRFLSSCVHVGPVRQNPERNFFFGGIISPYVGANGKYTNEILVTNPELVEKVNKQLSSLNLGYQIQIVTLAHDSSDLKVSTIRLISDSGIDHAITDVGYGISQVLPVILQCMMSSGETILIEQPELHLHPAQQAELGDLFINAALGEQKNTIIIETHSEHLLLRIMRRMRETCDNRQPTEIPKIHPKDVMILFVEPIVTADGTQKSIVREMPLNERGELVKAWPGGFFEEGLKEIF
ncbi:MAG: hypothetical protein BWX92_03906 [Deltaproteobacteria bacterium ADurb.Bin135]|nr:MAG: hypothetical protein BWX92_03906 [Deltaproteobacteria bacterium ADurb.Bin135]